MVPLRLALVCALGRHVVGTVFSSHADSISQAGGGNADRLLGERADDTG
jgi:hypothetical protein